MITIPPKNIWIPASVLPRIKHWCFENAQEWHVLKNVNISCRTLWQALRRIHNAVCICVYIVYNMYQYHSMCINLREVYVQILYTYHGRGILQLVWCVNNWATRPWCSEIANQPLTIAGLCGREITECKLQVRSEFVWVHTFLYVKRMPQFDLYETCRTTHGCYSWVSEGTKPFCYFCIFLYISVVLSWLWHSSTASSPASARWT